ncbi:hypothetical protein CAPTEDRAFT_129621 [Capitella teleta]|uniref:Hedgehog protein n=1 Tax=Capitella teleta TaxID=283909 RepID=Q2QJG8_CAPTE|nr:hedgehog protein [Capitella teleta]ELU09678.1 hypothetical protein CAPTEDRAFT_129621 [Capitella teleta]|eukprot:ELU09678.1 hypothetical protein CAPTEDRAFT_129621 [Capitella teleta]
MHFHDHLFFVFCLLALSRPAWACGPGRASGRRRGARKMTPLVFKQHVPNISENTLGASGLNEGRITRDDPRFKDLVENYNPDVVFKDEEGTGADRIMSQRCKDKINTLAISVMNQWPGVKLKVTEAWDEDGFHAKDSLHYEGRAVDITTDDRDRSKYGMLARLAVEAGFDWVYYENRGHIHCSVKSDSSITAKTGGCFSADDTVKRVDGSSLPIQHLRIGDAIQASTDNGDVVYSPVILFLHREENAVASFVTLKTEGGRSLTLSPSHLIHTAEHGEIYASDVKIGQHLLALNNNRSLDKDPVVAMTTQYRRGVFAPLTAIGTIVVNDISSSCYAHVQSHAFAHAFLAPVRWHYQVLPVSDSPQEGVHWYVQLLYDISTYVLPSKMVFSPS